MNENGQQMLITKRAKALGVWRNEFKPLYRRLARLYCRAEELREDLEQLRKTAWDEGWTKENAEARITIENAIDRTEEKTLTLEREAGLTAQAYRKAGGDLIREGAKEDKLTAALRLLSG